MLDPACLAGSRISPKPACGPDDRSRRSLQILESLTAARFKVPVEGPHPDESFWLDQLEGQARMFGFPPAQHFVPDRWLQEGDTVQFGNVTRQLLDVDDLLDVPEGRVDLVQGFAHISHFKR